MLHTTVRSLLLIRLSSMGDVLLSTALARQIRATYPNARIDIVTDARFADCYRHNPHINTHYTVTPQSRIPQEYSAQEYEVIVDLQKNIRSRALTRYTPANIYRIDKSRIKKLALVYAGVNFYDSIEHITDRYRRAASSLPLVEDTQGLELWLPEEEQLQFYPPEVRLLNSRQPITIALAPGAHHATKQWLPESFAELAIVLFERYEAKILLLGGVDDVELCQNISTRILEKAKACHYSIVVENHAGASSLFTTARLLDTTHLLVTNDTGVMHIGSARRVPLVAIFGSTVQEFGFTPYRVPHRIVEIPRAELSCRPCTHIGRAKCPKKHFRCMRDLHVDHVVTAVNSLWGSVY